ncbi:MAG: hypothetical protein IPQ07_07220 [Myxococcales bacterium]|nr:hypothetical protein [Myxococcales bacterium]
MVVATLASAVALAAAACGNTSPAASKEVQGTLVIAGETVTVTKCRPDHGLSTYVVLENAKGAVRFEDKRMFWSSRDPEGTTQGHALDCTKLDRSWGGGVRLDNTAYWRGTLAFECKDGATPITGQLTLDCGNITPEERASLDQQRTDLRQQQAGSGSGSGSAR